MSGSTAYRVGREAAAVGNVLGPGAGTLLVVLSNPGRGNSGNAPYRERVTEVTHSRPPRWVTKVTEVTHRYPRYPLWAFAHLLRPPAGPNIVVGKFP
jgi:hypothetical protein